MESFDNIIPDDFQGGVLVLEKGKAIFEHCQGKADLDKNIPFTPHTTITLASLSKQFVAVAMLRQIEQGRLSLDETIDYFFPQYLQGKKITIRHLLHHSSGIPDYVSDRIIPDAISRYESKYGKLPIDASQFSKHIAQELRSISLSECFEMIAKLPLHFEPGTEGKYSNTNYFLSGHILEMITGKSLPVVMGELFSGFGLQNTHMNGRIADACGYVKSNDQIFSCGKPAMDSADSSVVSCLNDLRIWCNAVLSADVLTAASWKEFLNFTPKPYGCGVLQFNNGWFGHDGGLPGLRHWQRINFERKVAIIVLSNIVIDKPKFLTKMMDSLIH